MKAKQVILAYQEFFAEKNLDDVGIYQLTQYVLEKNNLLEYQIIPKHIFSSTILPLNKSTIELANELRKYQVKKSVPDLNPTVFLTTGQVFPKIEHLNKVFDDNENEEITIEHQPGEVLLIQIWATWCNPCQMPMANNQIMLDSNESKWNGKVRIFGLSIDKEKRKIIERVNERKWYKVKHVWAAGNPALTLFSNQGSIPFITLINMNGKIDYCGHPGEIDVESRINELLNIKGSVDDYKKAKGLSKNNLLKTLNDKTIRENKIKIELNLKKHKFYSKGNSIERIYDDPCFVIKYNLKEKDIVDKIVGNLATEIEIKQICTDPKFPYFQSLNFLRKELQEHELEEMNVSTTSVYIMASFAGKADIIEHQKYTIVAKENTSLLKKENIIKFQSKLDVFMRTSQQILDIFKGFKPKCEIGKGDLFRSFPVDDLNSEEPSLSILSHVPGEILMVDFWATWCSYCDEPMDHNEKMLVENEEKWKGKVRIVAVSTDSVKISVVNKLKTKKWEKIHHFIIPRYGEKGNELYEVEGLPNIILINPKGIIEYKGNPKEINIEKVINLILEENDKKLVSEDEVINLEQEISNNYKSLKKFVKHQGKILLEKVRQSIIYPLDFIAQFEKEFCLESFTTLYKKPIFTYRIRKSDKEKLECLIPKDICPHEKLIIKEEVINTLNLKFGLNCEICKCELKDNIPQFYCKDCDIYFCFDCANKIDMTKTGSDSLIHPHNLLYIDVDSLDSLMEIDEYKFGKNTTFKENIQNHCAICNGCGKGIKQCFRWICISCRPGPTREGGFNDICDECFTKLRKDDSEIIKNLEGDGHIHKKHLLLRICFGNNTYYTY